MTKPATPLVYLDHNATTPPRPAVITAMAAALAEGGNPSAVHAHGRRARAAVEDAREAVARLAGADPADIVFTSGGTEANDLALAGAGHGATLISAVEHDSVRRAVPGARVLRVDAGGRLDLDDLRRALREASSPALVSVMTANNETGVLQPVEAVLALAREAGARVHCDAVQTAGRLPLPAADYLTLSAHKLGGPAGIGALVARGPVAARLRGGGQERGRRAGTENVAGIVGFGIAARLAAEAKAGGEAARLAALRDRLEVLILDAAPEACIIARAAPRLANTTAIAMPGTESAVQVMALDLAGFAVSAGAACSSGKVARSHVLDAMGVAPALAAATIRVSLGWTTKADDIDRFAAAWLDLYRRRQERRAAAA